MIGQVTNPNRNLLPRLMSLSSMKYSVTQLQLHFNSETRLMIDLQVQLIAKTHLMNGKKR